MHPVFKDSWVVGRPASADTFQLEYYVDVAIVDDQENEMPGVLTFTFEVVSPRWIEKHLDPTKLMLGRHFVVVLSPDIDMIDTKLEGYIATITGATPREIHEKLEKLGRSEGEDPRTALAESFFL